MGNRATWELYGIYPVRSPSPCIGLGRIGSTAVGGKEADDQPHPPLQQECTPDGKDIDDVKKHVTALLDEDLAWAESQPSPAPEEALGGVYAEA